MTTSAEQRRRRQREGSFTLIETVLALAIISFLIVEVVTVQGNSIVFSDFGRNITQATWLCRRVLSQVEYYWHTKPFKELETKLEDQKFEDFDEYSYSLEIKEWKFPFVKMLQNALGGPAPDDKDPNKQTKDDEPKKPKAAQGGDEGSDSTGISGMIDTVVKQIFGDEPIFMTAHVDVSWADGAQRNSTGMTYLITNQAKLDEAIIALKPVYDKLTKPPPKPGTKPGQGTGTAAGTGTAPGAGTAPGQPPGSGNDFDDGSGNPPPPGGGQPPPPPPGAPGGDDAGRGAP